MIIGIVAVAQNYAIGKDGKLPWHYPEDLKNFRKTTTGNAIVMGFNTWRSIGKLLPGRLNIVLSRSAGIDSAPNLIFVGSKDEVLALKEYLKCDLFIIGGAKTFANFADVIEKWVVTEVPVNIQDADTFMPGDFLVGFKETAANDLADGLVVREFHR